MSGFAVIDLETTGFVPERGDRVVEIGVVLLDDAGQIQAEWSSLVNPKRDIGASHVHGIRAADVLDAPQFGDLADDLLRFVDSRTVVAHNAAFDMRFLHAEMRRAGYSCDDRPKALCSMKWSGRLIGPAKLEHACAAMGIRLDQTHSALADAHATGELMGHLIRLGAMHPDWHRDIDTGRSYIWPATSGRPPTPPVCRGTSNQAQTSWLDKVLSSTWVPGVPDDEASYLLVLDAALLDRSISLTEGKQLIETARSRLKPGDRVVFTGEMSRDRDTWVSQIVAAGLSSGGGTKSTALLVAADPDSLSGKAAKARQYKIPVISETAFTHLFEDYLATHATR
ncbi:DNA polymerase-3 subunit epsilon [Micrococcales bacterium KH10]|nr:DNA polymerase-3 subunit epsilon [Micrococcales bacterium KH10]